MFKKTIALITVALMLFTSCSKPTPPNNAETAEGFIRIVLTMPNEDIADVVIPVFTELNSEDFWTERFGDEEAPEGGALFTMDDLFEGYSERMIVAITSMCEGYTNQEMLTLEGMGGLFYLTIVNFHVSAAVDGYTCTVESIELEETGERQYSYAATVITSYSDEPLIFRGNIRFDEDGLVCYMALNEPIYYAPIEDTL